MIKRQQVGYICYCGVMSDIQILQMALIGYESKRREIEEKIAEIRNALDGRTSPVVASPDGATPVPRGKRGMTAGGKARVAAAQRQRWAAFHKEKAPKAPTKTAPARKRKLGAAGRKAIADAMKKRWAAYRAAKAKAA
jgi:hypothetical protein